MTPTDPPPERTTMPASVIFSLVVVWLQVLANVLLGWLVLAEIDSRADHGQETEGEGPLRFLAYLGWALAGVLLVASGYFFRRALVACKVVYAYQVLALCFGALGIVFAASASTLHPLQILGVLLPGAVCFALSRQDADDWFEAPSRERSATPAAPEPWHDTTP
ncbi:hypothetical protein [Streptomyces sp. NPDC057702]|uniref:hypothetical protein n=1 Tax=unclassified Streptomyces TaxID=2593676 RepID=UPI0036B15EAB